MDLPEFGSVKECPKCGAGRRLLKCRYKRVIPRLCGETFDSYMAVRCSVCDHFWHELPKDASVADASIDRDFEAYIAKDSTAEKPLVGTASCPGCGGTTCISWATTMDDAGCLRVTCANCRSEWLWDPSKEPTPEADEAKVSLDDILPLANATYALRPKNVLRDLSDAFIKQGVKPDPAPAPVVVEIPEFHVNDGGENRCSRACQFGHDGYDCMLVPGVLAAIPSPLCPGPGRYVLVPETGFREQRSGCFGYFVTDGELLSRLTAASAKMSKTGGAE